MLTSELFGLAAKGQYVFLQAYLLKIPYTWAALAAAVYLWFFHKEIRWKILFPLLVIMIIVCSPLGYKYCLGRYFRLFWLFPRGILIAMAAVDLFRRFKNQWIRLIALVAAALLIFFTGANWFNDKTVKPAYTAYKIDEGLPELCDRMLEENPHPKAVFTGPWAPLMVRQYSSDIELLWGRNAYGFILPMPEEPKAVFKAWNTDPHNWESLFAYAKEHGYDYIGTTTKAKKVKNAAKENGYKIIAEAGDYYLFANKKRNIQAKGDS